MKLELKVHLEGKKYTFCDIVAIDKFFVYCSGTTLKNCVEFF